MENGTTDTSLLDNLAEIDLLKKFQSDIRSEWHGDEPDSNFFLLLGALFVFLFWAVFAVYFFSRVVGLVVGTVLKRMLPLILDSQQKLEHFSIGSFSISLLAGKIMFRDVLYITNDFVVKINDGWIIFSYWRLVPKKTVVQIDKTKGLQSSRFHVSFNGLKVHVFNRLNIYHTIAKTRQDVAASNFVFSTTNVNKTTAGRLFNLFTRVARKVDEKKLEEWWDNFWRLVGTVIVDISSCRLIAGNQQMPYAFAVTFENFSSKIYISDASNPEDLYMIRLKANMENTRISLVKQTGYIKQSREDPPRTMNSNEFAILQSANIQLFYHQDILGLVSEKAQQQSTTKHIPVWETICRLHKNTIISYGPWADKQRALLYSFFFPSDYGTVAVTQLPKTGERRIYLQHATQIFFTNDASLDFWFMRNDELNAIHSRINHGSSIECMIPWICYENGYQSVIEGSFLFLEATTSLPFREFINCESAHFNLTVDFPRVYNAHQTWNFNLQLHRITTFIVWDHKRFFTDLIEEWGSDERADLCKFVPYTWTFHINIIDQFEVLLLLNDKNWIDTSTTSFADNTQAAIIGNQLLISFSLPFVEFAPDWTNVDYEINAFNQLALRVCVPPQSPMEPLFKALHSVATRKKVMTPSTAFITTSADKGFIEVWRTESILIQLKHKYHPFSNEFHSEIPTECLENWLPKSVESPALLEPDDLYVNIVVTESEIELSGMIARLIFDLKDNYFGSYDQISDINSSLNGSVALKMVPERAYPPEHYRPMNVKLEIKFYNVRAHCLTFGFTTDSSSSENCPVIFNEQIAVELSKIHTEALIQVQLAPTVVYFVPEDVGASFMSKRLDSSMTQPKAQTSNWLSLSGLQFRGNGLYSDEDVPWKMEILEYAWLVEVIVGDIVGNLQPQHLFIVEQFVESFLLLSLFPDESNLLPEKYNICQHFESIRTCTKSTLRACNSAGNPVRCLSSETLKYKLVRVSVDEVNFLMRSDEYTLQLQTENIRFSFCNVHNSSSSENIILKVPALEVNQLVYYAENDIYLQCGQMKIKKVDLDIRLPCDSDAIYLIEERKQFLRKHDKRTNYLYFIWHKAKPDQHCGCFGFTHFFADHDLTGLSFFEDGKKMALTGLNQETGAQAGYLQSIIHRHKSGVCLENVPESLYKSSKSQVCNQKPDSFKRQLSDSSYKSANSQNSNDLSALVKNYAIYLGNYEIENRDTFQPGFWHAGSIQEWIDQNYFKIKKITDGVAGLRLSIKPGSQKQASSSSPDLTSDNSKKQFSINHAKDLTALCISGQIADCIEGLISPLSVDILSQFSFAIADKMTTIHPALLVQRVYFGCAFKHHLQPLISTSSASSKNNTLLKNPIYVNVKLPQLNWIVFQSEPALVHDTMLQPLNFTSSAFLFYLQESQFYAETVQSHTYFQSAQSNSNAGDKKLTAELSNLRVPESLNGQNKSFAPNRLQTNCTFPSFHVQLVHVVDKNQYDQNVYSKIPFYCINNWTQLLIANNTNSQLRVLCEAAVKEIELEFELGNDDFDIQSVSETTEPNFLPSRLNFNEKTSKESNAPLHSLEIDFTTIQITSVLGKTTEGTSNESIDNELSFYEVFAPSLNIWMQVLTKLSTQVKQNSTIVEEWNDLIFLKLLADCLDWSDDQPYTDKQLKNPRVHAKQLQSCPSCKLTLTLMRYVAKNSALLYQKYWAQILSSVDHFQDKKVRKQAVIALLSHWQTLICSQIQLFDNHIAQKYKCTNVPDSLMQVEEDASKPAVSKSKTTLETLTSLPVDSGQILSGSDPFDERNSAKMPSVDQVEEQHTIERQKQQRLKHSASTPRFPSSDESTSVRLTNKRASGHKRQCSTTSATTFQPGHQRGPSTLTQATITTDTQPKSEDLYHWILRAQKEHKQKHVQTLESQEGSQEVNPMELMLSVFFWTIYQKQELDHSIVDTIPLPPFNLDFVFQLTDMKFDIIERKLLKSPSNQTFVSVNCHHLAHIEGFELKGSQLYYFELDTNKLKPLRAQFFTNFTSKIHNIRLIASLASICFLNDVSISIQSCCSIIAKNKPRSAISTVNQRLKTFILDSELDWAGSVMDKLLDYQRFASRTPQRNSQLAINTVGMWTVKTVLLESMLSDLFISTTMMRIELTHAHQRLFSSQKHFSLNSVTNIKPTFSPTSSVFENKQQASNEPKPLDLINLEIRRANLIFSEHRSNQRKMSETKQILNCSLRQSFFKFETFSIFADSNRLLPTTNNLLINLGEIDGELPMHAQSIHDVVMRHGPQLNEQLQKIITKRPQHFPIDYTVIQSPYTSCTRHCIVTTNLGELAIDIDENSRDRSSKTNDTGETSIISDGAQPTRMVDVQFVIQLTSLELNAQLLPSLKTKYKLTKASASGCVGNVTEFSAEILEHQVCFIVLKSHNGDPNAPAIDTFILPLPYFKSSGRYRVEPASSLTGPNPRLIYKSGGYHDIVVKAGPMEHTFSTDLLNQILFAEQSFRSELTFLLERLSVDQPSSSLRAAKPILFNLTFQGESMNCPWLQLTASTPTATAIRFTIDGPIFVLTNRLMPKPTPKKSQQQAGEELSEETNLSLSSQSECLFGRAKVQLNVKLGQICKTAMYEEVVEELQEYATFMTQISAQNEEISAGAFHHNYIITLHRPILLIKATAIDKAILLWLNYRNTYNYWRDEQRKLFMMANRYSNPNPSTVSTPNYAQQRPVHSGGGTDTHMNLSLNLAGSLYICMPLFSEDSDEENMSAMLVSLKKSDILVCVKKELACHAKFEAFKISFVDNFDEHSLSDAWLQEKTTGDTTHSNFVFFPEGSYYFCSSANPPTDSNKNAKWFLSIQSEMKGMVIDFDNKIGKLMNLCAHTLSSFAMDEDAGDDINYAPSEASSSFFTQTNYPLQNTPSNSLTAEVAQKGKTSVQSQSDPLMILDKTGTFDEMNRLPSYEGKIRWLERKMHEQSMKVNDFVNEGKTEYEIEMARKKLRVYELARFKQFRRSMLEKLRPRMAQKLSNQGVLPESAQQKKSQSGFAQIREASSSSLPNSQNSTLKTATESVDLNIDVQVKIETGHCILRAAASTAQSTNFYSVGTQKALTKRLSTKDLKNKANWQQSQSITTLQIPSLDTKLFYTSDAAAQLPPDLLRTFAGQQRSTTKNKCFYLALELAKMLEQTLVTPSLADFLEQVVEPLPESLFESSAQPLAYENQSNNADTVPIVALDTSVFPLDVFFHLTVYSSVIRFEGGEQRSSSAADCLLTLPSLTFMVSTCKKNDQDLNAGIYLSATLSNFEFSIYSPHQQATAHDALSVKLDKLLVTASRVKCLTTNEDDKNKVQLIIISNVGKADFIYDMRRLGELLSFPKPWYRKKLMQRVFFGEQSIVRKGSASTTHSAPAFIANNLATPLKNLQSNSQSPQLLSTSTQRSEWAAELEFLMQWSELNVKAQMSNVMGNTQWFVRRGLIRANIQLDSFHQKTIELGFKLNSSALSAQGGAISGDIEMRRLIVSVRHQKKIEKAPENVAKLELTNVESRIEWMSRPIFIGLLRQPQISISDKWDYHSNNSGKVDEACCMINVDGSWADLQMIITKNTTRDMTKIVQKLISFFNDQIRSSRMVWGHYELDRMSTESDTISTSTQLSLSPAQENEVDSPDSSSERKKFSGQRQPTYSIPTHNAIEHWQGILDLATEVQMQKKFLPLPTVKTGITFVGGVVDFRANQISLACMNGEMSATTWALFHMREANTLLTCKSKYSFLSPESQLVGVHIEHRFVFKLGTQIEPPYAQVGLDECKATVCRVQHSRNFLLRHNASIELCLEAMITDVLKQMKLFKDDVEPVSVAPPRFTHNVLELFQFPALDATLITVQKQLADMSLCSEDEIKWDPDVVESSFICDFHNEVAVQTDFNAQVSFLPELLKSYINDEKHDESTVRSPSVPSAQNNQNGTTANKPVAKMKKDARQFKCQEWVVDPKIRFIDRFKWNPPLVDEILKKLQIFDHRTTIPKVMQRGVLDQSDLIIASLLEQIIRQALRE